MIANLELSSYSWRPSHASSDVMMLAFLIYSAILSFSCFDLCFDNQLVYYLYCLMFPLYISGLTEFSSYFGYDLKLNIVFSISYHFFRRIMLCFHFVVALCTTTPVKTSNSSWLLAITFFTVKLT